MGFVFVYIINMDTYTEGFVKQGFVSADTDDWEIVDDDIDISEDAGGSEDDGQEDDAEEEKADAILSAPYAIVEKPTIVREALIIVNDNKKQIARSVMLNIILCYLKHSHQYSLGMNLIWSSVSLVYMMIKYRRFALVLCRLPIFC
jgi:hypothetical protein